MHQYKINTLGMAFFVLISISVNAQKDNNLKTCREFFRLCNNYKKLPLHLSAEYKSSVNFSSAKEDTIPVQADFYIQQGAAYVRFGNVEQVLNDSFALVIMEGVKQMVLSGNSTSVEVLLKNMSGQQFADTALETVSAKYKAEVKALGNGRSMIRLSSRNLVYNTNIPMESVEMFYNLENAEPEKVITVKRKLIYVAGSDSTATAMAVSLHTEKVVVPGEGNFVVQERSTEFIYKKISHAPDLKIPVVLADRIFRDKDGNYVPVKAFESYYLSYNF